MILPRQHQGEHDFRLEDVQNTQNIALDTIERREMIS
jgi:hypothetical protein